MKEKSEWRASSLSLLKEKDYKKLVNSKPLNEMTGWKKRKEERQREK